MPDPALRKALDAARAAAIVKAKPETTMQKRARDKRRQIYDFRRDGNSWDEIGARMNLAPKTCLCYCEMAVKKDGLPPFESPDAHTGMLIERKSPEAAAGVIAAMTMAEVAGDDPKFKDLKDACKLAGLKPTVVQALIKRLQAGKYSPVTAEVKRLVGKELIDKIDEKIGLVFEYMDEFAVSQASLKDLSIASSVLIEKRQLLSNQPTHIIDFTSRQQIGVLVPMMMAEAKRRGITVDGTSERVGES